MPVVLVLQWFEVFASLLARFADLRSDLDGECHECSLLHLEVLASSMRVWVFGDNNIWVEGVPFAPIVNTDNGIVWVFGRYIDVDLGVDRPDAAFGDCGRGTRPNVLGGAEVVVLICCARS